MKEICQAVLDLADFLWIPGAPGVAQPRQASPTAGEALAFARSQLAALKTPQQVRFVERLPVTATGKLQRYRLRAMVADSRGQESGVGGQESALMEAHVR
jgi:acyl-coenzyme A synthetase/AMP-(fatty) acid ligase